LVVPLVIYVCSKTPHQTQHTEHWATTYDFIRFILSLELIIAYRF